MHITQYRSYTIAIFFLCLLSLLSSCSIFPAPSSTSSLSATATLLPTQTPTVPLPTPTPCIPGTARPQPAGIQVTVNLTCPSGVSNYAPGLTHSDNSLVSSGDPTAIAQVHTLEQGTILYENTHIMGWGAPDPWPDPTSAEPTDWSGLDSRLQAALAAKTIPVISLDEAPWWMKGQLQGGKTTHALTSDEEWNTIAYESRILDNKMGAWQHLIQRIAERYMKAPYNVRYFQVWNELKGYYDPQINAYDITTNPGKPNGPNAQHGYTYMYNQVYTTLLQTAQSLHIAPESIQVGGPYVFATAFSTPQSNPSNIKKAYGTLDQRPLDVIQYWLQHKTGAGFITFDSSNENTQGDLMGDAFSGSEIFADVVAWIRTLDPTLYPGSTTLPIWLAEWFASPGKGIGIQNDYDNAVKSYAMVKFIQAGGAVAFSWGGSGDGTSDQGYWAPTTYAGGGYPHPWYDSLKTLVTDFGRGKVLYPVTISQPDVVAALATAQNIMLINKTPNSLSLQVNGAPVTLTPYQVITMNDTPAK